MPLPHPNTIDRVRVMENARYLYTEEGYEKNKAISAAFSEARKIYFKRHPEGLLPAWLAFNKAMRTKHFYTDSGTPIRANPLPARLRDGARLYKGFTGDAPNTAVEATLPGSRMAVGLVIGSVTSLELDCDGVPGLLKFDRGNFPSLVVSANGRKAAFSGGDFSPVLSNDIDKCRITAILYQTVRDGKVEYYRHPFANFAQPALKVVDARNAIMSGGSFRFSDRGFIDVRP